MGYHIWLSRNLRAFALEVRTLSSNETLPAADANHFGGCTSLTALAVSAQRIPYQQRVDHAGSVCSDAPSKKSIAPPGRITRGQ